MPISVSSGAVIRPARTEDLPHVEALLAGAALPLDGVAAALPHFLVAEHAERIVGVVGLEPCGADALLRSLAVDPAWRSRGVGRELVRQLVAAAEARGVRALWLLTTTAERWFPGTGFAAVARDAVPAAIRATDEFRSVCPASAIVMTRPLLPAAAEA